MDSISAKTIRSMFKLVGGQICCTRTGLPRKLNQYKGGYLRFTVRLPDRSASVTAHRVIWLLHYGRWPNGTVDHINFDPTDNRIENLREMPLAENCVRKRKHLYVPGRGVTRDGTRWRAEITVAGRRCRLGGFATREAAEIARREAESRMPRYTFPPDFCARNEAPRALAGRAVTPTELCPFSPGPPGS